MDQLLESKPPSGLEINPRLENQMKIRFNDGGFPVKRSLLGQTNYFMDVKKKNEELLDKSLSLRRKQTRRFRSR